MKGSNASSEINKSSEMDFGAAGDAVCQVKNSNGEMEAQSAAALVCQLSEASRREIENLVGKLMTYHKKLQTDGDRIQLDIEDYAELNQRVRQLTTIIADSVGELSDRRSN